MRLGDQAENNPALQQVNAVFEQEAMGMALCAVDPNNSRWLRVNQKFCDMLGYTREELLQLTSVEISLPDERHLAVKYNEQLLRGDFGSYSREKRYLRKDGTIIWTNIWLSAVLDPDGNPIKIISVIQDISERKRAEEALSEREKTYEKMTRAIEQSSEMIVLFDPKDRIVFANQAWRQLNKVVEWTTKPGITFEQHLRALTDGGFVPEAIGHEEKWIAERLERHRNPPGPFELSRQDNKWISINEQVLEDGSIILVISDITDRKRAEMALKQSESKLREILKNSPMGVAVVTHATDDARITGDRLFVNAALVKMFCLASAADMLDADISDSWVNLDQLREVEKIMTSQDELVDFQALRRRVDGTEWWVSMNSRPIRFDGRECTIVWHFDITERKRAEEALREAHEKLEQRVEERTSELNQEIQQRIEVDEALRNSEARFKDFAEGASDWFWEMDENLRYTYHSPRYFEITCFRPEDKIGTTRTRYVDPADLDSNADKWAAHMKDLEARRPFKNFEFAFNAKHGATINARISGISVFDAEGNFQGYRGTGTDITERKRAEKELIRHRDQLQKRDKELTDQNERFEAAINHITAGLCMYDENHRLVVCNDTFGKMYGVPPELLRPGMTMREVMEQRVANGIYAGESPEEYHQNRLKWVSKRKAGSKTETLSDGRTIQITQQPMESGGWVTMHEDITEQKRTEQALLQSEELMTKAFQANPGSASISTPEDGKRFDVNETWIATMGYSREEAMAHSVVELGIWVDAEARVRFVEKLKTEKSVRAFEAKFRTKDGREIDCLLSGEYLEVGGKPRLLVVSDDITERKKAEEALRESKRRFQRLVETTNVIPWELDPSSMRFTYVGPQAVARFGYPIEDWYSEDFWMNCIHPDDRDEAVDLCKTATERLEDHDFEYRMIKANGDVVWVRDVVSVVEEGGDVKALRGFLIDIDDLKTAEIALRSSQQRFKDIVEVSSDWIWECDEDLRFTYFSERFTEVTGVATQEVLGKTRHEVGHGADADWDAHFADLVARRSFRDFRYRVTTKSGHHLHWSISGRPIFDETGVFKGYRGTGSDRTAEVEAECELIRHRDHLQELVEAATTQLKAKAEELQAALGKEKELNELQRQFVTMASHEFRTPLTIIDGSAQRIKSRADKGLLTSEDAGERAGKIRDAVKRMTRLMESTLTAARMQEGKIKVEIKPCDISKVVSEACARQQGISRDHVIACDLADLPATIQADTDSLDQVLTNLLSNAVKYAPDAPDIKVMARTEGHQVVISVCDHGIGIDEHDLSRIGERFFRARTSTGIAGTGIGLNLVKTLVEMHGGSVKVESKKGAGSSFTICLPIDGPDQSEQADTKVA